MEIETLLKTGETLLIDTPKKDKHTSIMIKAIKDKLEQIEANKKLASKTLY